MSVVLPEEDEILDEETTVALPRWIDALAIPLVNLAVALTVAGLVILLLGENPFTAVSHLVTGAVGSKEALGYSLFYATNFVFAGLAVAIAFHCGLLNLGGEGQAYAGGLAVAAVCLYGGDLPAPMLLVGAVAGGALFGALWGAVPGYLQGARGSHIVITTIMFNLLAAALTAWLLRNILAAPGEAGSAEFPIAAWLPKMHVLLSAYGLDLPETPLNLSIVLAGVCGAIVWFLIWHTAIGYEIRVVGRGLLAARYAGIPTTRTIMLAMALSGAMAGLMGINELMGSLHRLTPNFVAGYGLAGVAVAIMGRNHPAGIFMAAFLFGALYQGGAQLAFEMPAVPTQMVLLIQGLVVLFAGALPHVFRPYVAALWQGRGQVQDAWRAKRERTLAGRERQRQAKAERSEAQARARAAAKAKAQAEAKRKAEEAAAAPKILSPTEALERARERGRVEYEDILRRSGQAVASDQKVKRKRARWLSALSGMVDQGKARVPDHLARPATDDDDDDEDKE